MMDIMKQALDLLKERAYFSRDVDWEALAAEIADLPPDVAILKAVKALKDHHSFYIQVAHKSSIGPLSKPVGYGAYILAPDFIINEISPQSAADQAGLQVGDVVEQVDGETPATSDTRLRLDPEKPVRLMIRRGLDRLEFTLTAGPVEMMPMPYGHMVADGIGCVTLFAHGNPAYDQAYIDAAQAAIRDCAAAGAKAWIVDLRRNRGGNMWTMITGIGPLLGDGLLGAFINADGGQTRWFHRSGVSLYQQSGKPEEVEHMRASNPVPTFKAKTTPVAVLTSRLTDSSGEMTLIALRGRKNTRTFGETTTGNVTGVAMHELKDGSILGIAESIAADRTAHAYVSIIKPDEAVEVDWHKLNKDDDPVVAAAVKWLRSVS